MLLYTSSNVTSHSTVVPLKISCSLTERRVLRTEYIQIQTTHRGCFAIASVHRESLINDIRGRLATRIKELLLFHESFLHLNDRLLASC